MEDFKMRINSYLEFEKIQVALFNMGCEWYFHKTTIRDLEKYPSDKVLLVKDKTMFLVPENSYNCEAIPLQNLDWIESKGFKSFKVGEHYLVNNKNNETMTVKIKCKDSTTPVYYKNVISHFTEGNTLALLFEDGKVRNFPFMHIWYYETEQPREKTIGPSEIN